MIGLCDDCKYSKVECKGNKDLEKTKCEYFKEKMSKEEAIKILKQIQRLYGGLYATSKSKEAYDAFDMAIEALQTQNISKSESFADDLISRADAIEAVCDVVMSEYDLSPTYGYEVAEKALSTLPSADRPTDNTTTVSENDVIENQNDTIKSADRPSGEWIKEHSGNGWNDWWNITCPFCGKKFEKLDPTNFCPNCGADMRGEKK